LNRITFIMLYKLALQMNLQLTYVIITRINLKQQHQRGVTSVSVLGLFSVMSMLYTFGTELYDAYGVMSIFHKVKNASSGSGTVKEKVFRVSTSRKLYAVQDLRDEDGAVQRITYLGRDLFQDYLAAARIFWRLILLTTLCVWLILYAILKFFAASYCPSGAWELLSGCLNLQSSGSVVE